MRHHMFHPWAACALTVAMLVGCTVRAPQDTDSEAPWERFEDLPQYYTLWSDDYRSQWIVDQDGQTVEEDERFTVLYDQVTAEPQCMYRYRLEPTGEYDENDNVVTRDMSALYDLEGNLLYDWEECKYAAGFGDFVIRQNRMLMFYEDELPDDFESSLWNYKTGEVVVKNAGIVSPLEGGERVFVSDAMWRPLGIVDLEGNAVGGFPLPEQYQYYSGQWNGYFLASDRALFSYSDPEGPSETYYLLTEDFEAVMAHDYISTGYGDSVLWCYDNWDTPEWDSRLINLEGETLFQFEDGGPNYFDDELMVHETGNWEQDNIRYHLIRLSDGEVLAGDYEILSIWTDYSSTAPAPRFAGYKDGELQVITRDGEITATREMPGLRYLEYYAPDMWRCSIDMGETFPDEIVDGQLNAIIPAGKYNNIMQASEWYGDDLLYFPLFTGERYEEHSRISTVDILDLEGNILVGDLGYAYQVGPNRLAVRQGFSQGLMDWEGNWIVKRSIFNDLID